MPAINFSQPMPVLLLSGRALSSAGFSQYVGGNAAVRQRAPASNTTGFSAPFGHATHLPTNEDAAIVAAMARQDERAAAQLYDKYSAAMFGLAVRIVGEGADAEDVVLDAFTQAWNTADRYDADRGTVTGWLTTITRTRALDCVRSRGRRLKAVDAASRALADEPVAVAGASASAPETLELDERAAAVTSAMAVLSGHQRNAITLAFFDGLTHSEIAERLGEPLGTIKTRIRLGMQRLRDVLLKLPEGVRS